MLAPVYTPTGQGYFLVDSTGAVEALGDAQYSGGLNVPGGPHMNPGATCTGLTVYPVASTGPDWEGEKFASYLLGSSDGGVYSFGGAPFFGAWK